MQFQPKDPRRYKSAFSKKQRDKWVTQIWNVAGARQAENEIERRIAAYPGEIVTGSLEFSA